MQGSRASTVRARLKITDSAEDAANEVIDFYRNYHSRRFVGNQLVMRLRSAPSDEELALLNEEFAYLLAGGVIERTDPLPAEVHDNDMLEKARIKPTARAEELSLEKNAALFRLLPPPISGAVEE